MIFEIAVYTIPSAASFYIIRRSLSRIGIIYFRAHFILQRLPGL